MHRIAQRIENRADLVIDLGRKVDGIEGRDLQVFREGAGHIDAHAPGLGIEMEMAGPGHAALHADEMALARHPVARLHGPHMAADLHHLAGKFMAHDHGHGNGLLRPGIPFPDMKVGPANAGLRHLDEDVVGTDSAAQVRPSSPAPPPVPP